MNLFVLFPILLFAEGTIVALHKLDNLYTVLIVVACAGNVNRISNFEYVVE